MKRMTMLAIGIFISGFVISPFLGMAISPTRELILGLAPDQAVLELADKIEEAKVESNEDIGDMQKLIEEQKAVINEQNKKIEELEKRMESVPSTIDIENIAYCQNNASKYTSKKYKEAENRADEDNVRDSCIESDSSSCDKAVKRAEDNFENYKAKYKEYHEKCD